MVTTCFLGGPRKSSFVLCSRIHIIAPPIMKKIPIRHHIWAVNGCRNAQALEGSFLTGATTTSPDSMYGWVKSAILVLSVMIAMSPIAASYSCMKKVRARASHKAHETSKNEESTRTPALIKRISSVPLVLF